MKLTEKYILCPDCDDDRRQGNGFVNPFHEKARAAVYFSGPSWNGVKMPKDGQNAPSWSPPYSLALVDGVRVPVSSREPLKSVRAGVHALWFKEEEGHRILLIGMGATLRERRGLTEDKARTLWDRLQDFITIKTLWNLGFK